MTPVYVTKRADRAVVVIMVAVAKMVPYHLERGRWDDTSLPIVEAQLADTPCFSGRPFADTVCPARATPALLDARWGSGSPALVQNTSLVRQTRAIFGGSAGASRGGKARRALLDAWNARDLAAFGALLASDVYWHDLGMPHPPAIGREAAVRFVESALTAFPDFTHEIRGPICVSEDGRHSVS